MNDTEIAALESAWGITLPASYQQAVQDNDGGSIGDCDLLTPEELRADSERRRGMFPRMLPFAWQDDEHVYAFLAGLWAVGRLPVVCWDRERDHCWPVAGSYDAAVARIELEAAWDEVEDGGSESDLARRIVALDPAAADAQLHLACRALALGDLDGARSYATQAAAATPWFADAHYVAGVIAQASENTGAAIEGWWRAVQCPVALSTSTDRYDLGANHPAVEMQEGAVDALERAWSDVAKAMRESLVGRCVARPDTFAFAVRVALAAELDAASDPEGAERERLNALALATSDREIDAAYDALIAAYERAGRAWDAGRCRLDRRLEE